ncbi:ABC transporter ATP-binding protein [Sulfuricurvum sp.]|uniref:ABC transporter ATP-binding protein n=1 Tax=Sulfuricurvum sp. TaxID=2025608 RepID=UPI00261E528E|nr:ABC transporter ATP-binding protein [Sulfuricurvum sp.]MDD2782022.1 ABC transporter ATP-binding protein [Sulfuricurvum sp.]
MIRLENLSKSYPLKEGGRHYVFDNFNFTFPENHSIGLLGPNGAGKSTLLRILGRIDLPDSGRVITDKKISWPVGLSGGFQGSLSARDNVKFISRVYGYTGEAMREKIAYVQEFAEIGEYFDEPIKTFSSGMRSRIAFGLSMAFDFDYYLIDEVGAVGDPAFKQKSKLVYQEKLKNANVIMVSHVMADIKAYCDYVVVVNGGQASVYEDVDEGIAVYQKIGQKK